MLPARRGDRALLVADAAAAARRSTPTSRRHGFGYSVFEHTGRRHSLRAVRLRGPGRAGQVLGPEGAQRISGAPRRLSATGYVEWVLGDLRPKIAMHVVTEIDAASGALFARNPYNSEFPDRVAFFDVDDPTRTLTGDRTEFLGRNGTLGSPAAMTRARLSGRVGAGLDPCAAHPGALRTGRRPGTRDRLPARRRARCRRRRPPGRSAIAGRRPPHAALGRGAGALEAHARRRAGGDARPGGQRAGQRLARLPDAGLPPLGAQRLSTSRAALSASATSCRT